MRLNVVCISVAIGLLATSSSAAPIVSNVGKLTSDVTGSPSGLSAPLAGTGEFAQKTVSDVTRLTTRQGPLGDGLGDVGGDALGDVLDGVDLDVLGDLLRKRQAGGGDAIGNLVAGVPVAGKLLEKGQAGGGDAVGDLVTGLPVAGKLLEKRQVGDLLAGLPVAGKLLAKDQDQDASSGTDAPAPPASNDMRKRFAPGQSSDKDDKDKDNDNDKDGKSSKAKGQSSDKDDKDKDNDKGDKDKDNDKDGKSSKAKKEGQDVGEENQNLQRRDDMVSGLTEQLKLDQTVGSLADPKELLAVVPLDTAGVTGLVGVKR